MNKKHFNFIIFLILFLFINIIPRYSYAAGADVIFFEIGQDKPIQWDTWPREQKHSYYKSLGIYPDSQGHYSGKTGNLDTYFEILGKEMPSNWPTMTFTEKKIFVQVGTNKQISNQSIAEITKNYKDNEYEYEDEHEDDDKKAPLIILVLLGTIFGSMMIVLAYKTDKSC